MERSAGGQDAVWGTVTRWEPPVAVAFTWHPGRPADQAGHVLVTFAAADSQTLVRLEHTGWDAFDDPAAARAEYDYGWPLVLGRYREQAGAAAAEAEDGETWVALTQDDGSVTGGLLAVTVRPWQVMMRDGIPG